MTIRSLILNEPVVLRSDGRFTRDFLYIADAVDVQLMLAEKVLCEPNLRGEAFNFSLEVDLEIVQLVERIGELMGVEVTLQVNSQTKAEIYFMRVSSEKARDRLSWAPTHDLDAALQKTIDWYGGFLSNSGNS